MSPPLAAFPPSAGWPRPGRPWGLEGLRELRKNTKHTLVAIGGINAENAAQVVEVGADGVAVVSAICASADPETAARGILRAVDRALGFLKGDQNSSSINGASPEMSES